MTACKMQAVFYFLPKTPPVWRLISTWRASPPNIRGGFKESNIAILIKHDCVRCRETPLQDLPRTYERVSSSTFCDNCLSIDCLIEN
jgi:hypothetical protein